MSLERGVKCGYCRRDMIKEDSEAFFFCDGTGDSKFRRALKIIYQHPDYLVSPNTIREDKLRNNKLSIQE